MFGRRRGKHHPRNRQEVLAEIQRSLPEGIRSAEISDVALLGFATYPDGASATDFEWGIAYSVKQDQWAVIVAERQIDGVPPFVTTVSSQDVGIYICHLQHFMLEEMREHAKQKEAEEASVPGDEPKGNPEGKDPVAEPVPVVDGENRVPPPWPRVAREDAR